LEKGYSRSTDKKTTNKSRPTKGVKTRVTGGRGELGRWTERSRSRKGRPLRGVVPLSGGETFSLPPGHILKEGGGKKGGSYGKIKRGGSQDVPRLPEDQKRGESSRQPKERIKRTPGKVKETAGRGRLTGVLRIMSRSFSSREAAFGECAWKEKRPQEKFGGKGRSRKRGDT